MKFLSVSKFAKLKNCSRQNVYQAENKGEIKIDRTSGIPIVFLNEENQRWKPRRIGRPKIKV